MMVFDNRSDNAKMLLDKLDSVRQLSLLSESSLLQFLRDLNVPVVGVIKGDPSQLLTSGLLSKDGEDTDGNPLFHPFRLYPIYKEINLRRRAIQAQLDQEAINDLVQEANSVISLAVLLEPLIWPKITDVLSASNLDDEFYSQLHSYTVNVLEFLKTLDPLQWKKAHDKLLLDASVIDSNSELYLLLRLSRWARRKALKGNIAHALWLRHIAEVIRRCFEESYTEKWPEEDQQGSILDDRGREMRYGTERPIGNPQKSREYVSWNYGLQTGSVVRWYLDGTLKV